MSTPLFTRFPQHEVFDADAQVRYVPVVSAYGNPGYECTLPDGSVTYVYLNASGGSDDGVPTVFLYQGMEADPGADHAEHFAVVERFNARGDLVPHSWVDAYFARQAEGQ
jgi:hypothetical protein